MEARPPEHFEVWPENWSAVDLFLRCQTQWRMGIDGRSGLDYPAVLAVGRLLRVANLPAVFDDLQVMELVILTEGR